MVDATNNPYLECCNHYICIETFYNNILLTMNSIANPFVFIVTRLYSKYRTELAQTFASKGFSDVTPDYWIVLEQLNREENIAFGQLAQRTHKDSASITRIIGGMERNDLVVRTASASDRRSYLVSMSRYARSIFEQLQQIEQDVFAKATQGLNPIEVKELIRMMEHLFDRLEMG